MNPSVPPSDTVQNLIPSDEVDGTDMPMDNAGSVLDESAVAECPMVRTQISPLSDILTHAPDLGLCQQRQSIL